MFQILRNRARVPNLNPYPQPENGLLEGVYNRWKSAYLEKMGDGAYSAMGDTIEYFVVTAIDDSQTHVVRVLKDTHDSTKYVADYSADSKVFPRSITRMTIADVLNAYALSEFEQHYASPRDHFGLRRVGTLDEFVEKMKTDRA